MSNSIPPGGSSTINGILYQLLWSLLRAVKLRVVKTVGSESEAHSSMTLILEPLGGGGDLQLKYKCGKIVEQLKSRSDGGTWSLKEIVEEVFPDLFLAVDTNEPDAEFRFITDGRMGNWYKVYHNFFRNLQDRSTSDNPLSGLNNTVNLSFSRSRASSFFPQSCTEKDLFLKIAHVISQSPAVKRLSLSETELHQRVRYLLCNFIFVGEQDKFTIQKSIDQILYAIVDKQEDIPKVRDHLTLEIAKASTVGGKEITQEAFFKKHGIDATPLTNWIFHIERAKKLVRKTTLIAGYDRALDVRLDKLPQIPSIGNILILTGESGTGKSWTLNSLAENVFNPFLPILIESEGQLSTTLQKCSELFWNDIHDSDGTLPFSRIGKRLDRLFQKQGAMGLTVFIDNVRSYEEAQGLVEKNWEELQSSLIFVCRPDHAKDLLTTYKDRIQVYQCKDFTWEELHKYVTRRLLTGWAEIPIDVREALLKPLLANIYCTEFEEVGWKPQSEYELYQKVWERLSTGNQRDCPFDVIRIEKLARSIINGSPYPWSKSRMSDGGIDDEGLIRLQRLGWIVKVDDTYRIFHDRLLQWAVAQSLCTDFNEEVLTAEELVSFVTDQARGDTRQKQFPLGYIPMDVLWILNRASKSNKTVSVKILESLEKIDEQYFDILYSQLVPTIGSSIAEVVHERLISFEGYIFNTRRIVKCLSIVGHNQIEHFARPLIESGDAKQRRKGLQLFRLVPCPNLLDRMWDIHVTAQSDPAFLGEDKKSGWQLYEESFEALKLSVQVFPEWLKKEINQADSKSVPVHDLSYLVRNLNDNGEMWQSVKGKLFEKVSKDKPRSLIANITTYRDKDELAWVRQWIGSKVDFVSSPALQALARLNSDEAVNALQKIDLLDLRMTKAWAFSEVFERRTSGTHSTLLDWVKKIDDPWKLILIYQDRENDISTDLLDIALDALLKKLEAKTAEAEKQNSNLYQELTFLSKISDPELLQILRSRRETKLEKMVRDYVITIGPQRGSWRSNLEREPALELLNRIGGKGLAEVIRDFLLVNDRYGQYEAIKWASRRPDSLSIKRLEKIVASDNEWGEGENNSFPINQREAMKVLARLGHWRIVVEGVKKWGMKISPDLLIHSKTIRKPWVDLLRKEIASSATAGNVLAIGAVGDADDRLLIYKVLDQSDVDPEIAHASIIALEYLEDQSDEAVEKVAGFLRLDKYRHSAISMLQHAGTKLAWDILFRDLKSNFNFVVALNLINLSDHADEVADLALSYIPSAYHLDTHWFLTDFIRKIRPENIREKVLNDHRVRELFHKESAAAEGNFWAFGSKANAIDCLSEFDPKAAFTAACQALTDIDAKDRERYPSILVRLDKEKGIDWLLEYYSKESSKLIC
ncbi:MAG: ATP-binding protein, partial [Desulfobacula sp.]|nr:ATP-binding protein [Desulfobacula sp.]